MVRNPEYKRKAPWSERAGPAQLDTVVWKFIPEAGTRVTTLESGETQGVYAVPAQALPRLEKNTALRVEKAPWPGVPRIWLLNTTKPPMDDVKVRRAINYAIDKDAFLATVYKGTGLKAISPLTAVMLDDPSLRSAYPFDAAKAKALLADAGMANGFELTAQALAGSADDAATLSTIQQMWAPLGVKLSIQQQDNATNVARYNDNDFQIQTGYWTDDIGDPSEITSYFAYFATTESQHSGYNDPTIQDLFEKSQKEADKGKRAGLYQEIQQIYVKAAPILFMYESPYPVALRKEVKGFVQIPLGNNIFLGAHIEK